MINGTMLIVEITIGKIIHACGDNPLLDGEDFIYRIYTYLYTNPLPGFFSVTFPMGGTVYPKHSNGTDSIRENDKYIYI